jgi:CrcB protein
VKIEQTSAETSGPAAAEVAPGVEWAPVPDDQSRPFHPWPPRLTAPTAIGLGGVLGANARYQVGIWAADRWGTVFPWGTLIINATGSLVLGFFLTLVTERFSGRPTTRLFVATGFLGAYTTFSAFSYETVRLIQAGELLRALAYVAASLTLGIAAIFAGIAGARAL